MKILFLLFNFCYFSVNSYSQQEELKLLKAKLLIIFNDDQADRLLIPSIQNKFGFNSSEIKNLFEVIRKKDSVNFIQVDEIVKRYGWLGVNDVGDTASATIFFVIQHSNFESRVKYLPIMRDAVKKGKAKAKHLALLEDRVALEQGKKQIYGSQVGYNEFTLKYYVLPLIDPESVDLRRQEAGLEPISEYLESWNIQWSIPDYNKSLLESCK